MANTDGLLLSIIALLVTISNAYTMVAGDASAPMEAPISGRWEQLKDPNDPYVVEIGKYAVTTHNKQGGRDKLQYIKVITGESLVVAGYNYHLFISAKNSAGVAYYEAVVYDRQWDHHRELISFNVV